MIYVIFIHENVSQMPRNHEDFREEGEVTTIKPNEV